MFPLMLKQWNTHNNRTNLLFRCRSLCDSLYTKPGLRRFFLLLLKTLFFHIYSELNPILWSSNCCCLPVGQPKSDFNFQWIFLWSAAHISYFYVYMLLQLCLRRNNLLYNISLFNTHIHANNYINCSVINSRYSIIVSSCKMKGFLFLHSNDSFHLNIWNIGNSSSKIYKYAYIYTYTYTRCIFLSLLIFGSLLSNCRAKIQRY